VYRADGLLFIFVDLPDSVVDVVLVFVDIQFQLSCRWTIADGLGFVFFLLFYRLLVNRLVFFEFTDLNLANAVR